MDYCTGLIFNVNTRFIFTDKCNTSSKVAHLFPQHGVHASTTVGGVAPTVDSRHLRRLSLLQSTLKRRTSHLLLSVSTSQWENASSTTNHLLCLPGVYSCFTWSPNGTTSTLWVFLFSIYSCTMNHAYTAFSFGPLFISIHVGCTSLV